MDKRSSVILAATTLTFSVLGLSLYEVMKHDLEQREQLEAYARGPKQPQAETRPLSAEETVTALLPGLAGEDELQRMGVVEQLSAAYEDVTASYVTPETRESLAAGLIAAFQKTDASTPEGAQMREEIVRLVVGRVGGEAARQFAMELLSSSTETVKLGAVKALTIVPSAVRGKDVAAKALELVRAGSVPESLRPALLRRFLGRKAEPEIQALFETAVSLAAMKACAVELQNFGKPELMGGILARLEGAGLLADHKKMPWLSGRLLSAHIRTASKEELTRAIDVIKVRPALTRATVKALKERLSDKEPGVRKMVAVLIPGAVDKKALETEEGLDLLVAQLQHEDDPVVKGVIEEGLTQMRLIRQPLPESGPAGASSEP